MNKRSIMKLMLCMLSLSVLPVWAQQSLNNPNALQGPGFIPVGGAFNPGINSVVQQSGSKGTKSDKQADSADGLEMDIEPNVKIGGNDEGLELRVFAGKESFEPILDKDVSYGALPKSSPDMTLTLEGPLPALEFLSALSTATKWNIVASPGVTKKELNFWLNKMTPAQAMSVLKFNEVHYRYDAEADLLYIMTNEEYLQSEHGDIERFEYILSHTNLESVESGVVSLLSHKGRMMADPRTSTIIILDTQENISHIQQLLSDLDQERISATYELKHANGGMLFDSIEVLLSEGGRMSYDPRSNTVIVLDRPERQKLIAATLLTLDLPVESKSWILNYADAELVAENLLAVIPENMGAVSHNKELHQVTVTAIAQRIKDVDALIKAWDQERKQVQIEAYLVTVSSEIARNIGVNWNVLDGLGDGNITNTFGDTAVPEASEDDENNVTGMITSFVSDDQDLSVMLNFLETEGDATILAHPRITVQDGQEALFENTTEVPYATTSVRNDTFNLVDTVRTTQVEFIDVGTILRVMPRITQDQKILMDIQSEDSSFTIREVVSNDKITSVPEKTQNLAETQVLSEDAQTLVIGGLRTSNFNDTKNKVPILGDIPLVGRAFRSTDKNHKQKELLIFITPTIIDNRTQPEAERLAKMDQKFADTISDDQKKAWERGVDNFFDRDAFIAVGQHGDIILDDQFIAVDEIADALADEKYKGKTLIYRTHPRASKRVVKKITKILDESGHKVKFDDSTAPFVPNASNNE